MAPTLDLPAAARDIAEWLETDHAATRVCRHVAAALPEGATILLIGGALRDRLMRAGPETKDLDFVALGIPVRVWTQQFTGAERNYFGGLTLEIDGCSVDLWRLEDTYHIRQFALEPTIENLLAGAPFNLDRMVCDIKTGALTDGGLLAGLRDRTIVYDPLHPYLEHIQAARCVLLERRTEFALDATARGLLARGGRALERSRELVGDVDGYLEHAHRTVSPEQRREVIARICARSAAMLPNVVR